MTRACLLIPLCLLCLLAAACGGGASQPIPIYSITVQPRTVQVGGTVTIYSQYIELTGPVRIDDHEQEFVSASWNDGTQSGLVVFKVVQGAQSGYIRVYSAPEDSWIDAGVLQVTPDD